MDIQKLFILIPSLKDFNPRLSEITKMNTSSKSFSFLKKEPDIYSISDLKVKVIIKKYFRL